MAHIFINALNICSINPFLKHNLTLRCILFISPNIDAADELEWQQYREENETMPCVELS